MKVIETLFGQSQDLNPLQMCCRAFVIYLIGLLYIRLSGKRAFGRVSTFDNIIAITLGAVLSRAIVGASPFFSVVACCLLLVLLHRFVSWISVRNKKIGSIIKGKAETLYKDGKIMEGNLRKNYISHHDLMEGIRIHLNVNTLEKVDEVMLERNGDFGVVKKEESKMQEVRDK
jgi:uncharacterized membrane protein YcaP (DUF421 family)